VVNSKEARILRSMAVTSLTLPFLTASTIIMSGAYGTTAADTDFRKKWDAEEYAEKAKKKDEEERERMQENEARLKQGTHSTAASPLPCIFIC